MINGKKADKTQVEIFVGRLSFSPLRKQRVGEKMGLRWWRDVLILSQPKR